MKELDAILNERKLQASFRPVADFGHCDMLGYIAKVCGPWGKLYGSFDQLAWIAIQAGRIGDFCRETALAAARYFISNNAKGRLFLPTPSGVVEAGGCATADEFSVAMGRAGCPTDSVVIMMPNSGGADPDKVAEFVARLRAHGFGLASRDFGCLQADQRAWSRTPPDYLLLDEHLFDAADATSVRNSGVYERLAAELERGRILVADGVTSSNDIRLLRELGIVYGAGDFIGRANSTPTRAMSAAAHKAIATACACDAGSTGATDTVLQRLLVRTAPVPPECCADDVFLLFERNPDLRAIAVVADAKPLGLISRYEMVDNMARPYRHELYGRKPCTRFMDNQPLVVEIGVALPELSELVVGANPRHLVSGFIITDQGKYIGMGSVQDLVREVTAMQMDAAKYANPLTQLPGNVPINQHIDNQLAEGGPCCIAYCDLDHFKPFNDVYGYAKGDEVIQMTARVLSAACDAECDFIGHIGGDDFVLVLRSEDWEARCRNALTRFSEQILTFFSLDDIERGGYITENRKGQMEFHRLTSLSIGAVEAPAGMFQNHLQVSKVAAEVKKRAKAIPGNSIFINQRQYVDDGIARAQNEEAASE